MSSPSASQSLIRALPEGPLDLIGDVHGEIEALETLLKVLGYTREGTHPAGRHLVFVGDLCDRGPDSPGVLTRVAEWVASGQAFTVLGNHELSVLRGLRKDGNDWFFGDVSEDGERYGPMRMLPASEQAGVLETLNTWPLILERSDLRVVHAAWDPVGVAQLRGLSGPVLAVFKDYEARLGQDAELLQLKAQSQLAKAPILQDMRRPDVPMQAMPAISAWDSARQMRNPVRVITSGWETPTDQPFFAGGSWRFVERDAWWMHDEDPRAVVFGHYWRRLKTPDEQPFGPFGRNLFYGVHPTGWFGLKQQAFCVDYSVGGRYAERLRGRASGFMGALAAMRWPERELVLDDGRRWMTMRPESV